MENPVFDRRLSAEPSNANCISQEPFILSQSQLRMIIKVKGYANMRQYTAHLPSGGDLEVPEACTVADVLKKLGVPSQWKKLLIVNGRHRTPDSILHSGDTLVFFPPLEGG